MSRLTGSIIIQKIDPEKKSGDTPPQTVTAGAFDSRLQQSSTFFLTPSRIRVIRKDPTVRLVRQAIVAPAIHTPWTYVEKSNAPAGAKDFIKETFEKRRDWLLQGAFYGALDFGWMPYELIYKPTKDGRIKITRFKQLLQDYTTILVYLDSGDYAGLTNWPSLGASFDANGRLAKTGSEVILSDLESMNINLEVEGTDWYGISVCSTLDSIITSRKNINDAANRYDKKVSGATWVVYYPVGKTVFNDVLTSNSTIATTLLASLEASGTVAVPDEIQEYIDGSNDSLDQQMKGKWRIELISARNQAQNHFNDRLKYLDNLIPRAYGFPERSLLEGQFGTKAEAETHGEIGLSTVDTKHRLIVKQFNLYAVNKLLMLNWGKEAKDTVQIQVAPLVSSRFNILKEVYSRILQNGDVLRQEVENLDLENIREELSIPGNQVRDIQLDGLEDPGSENNLIPSDGEGEGEEEE